MAGFICWNKKHYLTVEKASAAFNSLDYSGGAFIDAGEWNIIIFPKKSYNIKNWISYPGGAVCCTGTFAYKGKVYEQALPLIYSDFMSRKIDMRQFWGSFIILIYDGSSLNILRDGAGLTPLYSLINQDVYSTSFAALVECSGSKLTFDPDSATELLMTGVFTGNQTLVSEIKRVLSNQKTDKINIAESAPEALPKPENKKTALLQQTELIKKYFNKITEDWENYFPDAPLDLGITGGMDSRLMAASALNCNAKITFHTHWRKAGNKDADFRYAGILAKETGIPVNIKEVKHPFDMTNSEIQDNFEQAYCLSDGVIRPGCYWDEAYSTAAYRTKIINPPYLRLLGFGGEQYRNGERLPLKSSRSLKSWVKWEMMFSFAGRHFNPEKEAERTEKIIEDNIKSQLNNDNLKFNLGNYKEYIRQIQSPSYRSLQASMENRLGFCLNPFLDTCLSIPSKTAIPFLGKSLSFQLEILSIISPKVAAIPNCYGFNFTKGEPLHLKAGAVVWQYLPPWLKHPLYAKYKKNFFTNYIPLLKQKHEFIKDLENIVLQLDLPVNFDKYRLVRSRSRMMLNLGYFLKRNSGKIQYQVNNK